MRKIFAGALLIVVSLPLAAQSYPSVAGDYHPTETSPRVFDTAEDLRGLVQRIKEPGSFSAQMWPKLARQVRADFAAPVDWDAAYSGCDIDIYLRGFSFESSGGYAQEQRSAAQMEAALHVKGGLHSPAGAAPVAARLAMYAVLAKYGAPMPADAPPAEEVAALSKRILLAWAAHGFRDGPDGYKQKPLEFCEGEKRDPLTQTSVGLQVGRVVIYSVQAQDLLMGIKALSPEEIRALNSFHEAMWTLIRYSSNFAAEPEFQKPDRICEIYSNHRGMHILALLAIARLVDGEQWFEQALHNGLLGVPAITIAWTEYFDHAIYGEHDKPIACYPNPGTDSLSSKPNFQTQTVVPGEVEDRYRHANPEQGVGYPMFSLENLYFAGLVLKNAGLDPFRYRGRHGQSIRLATDYYACYAKNVGFGKTITESNANRCPGAAQYIGQSVSGVEENIMLGASMFSDDESLQALAPAAQASREGQSLDAILFGHWTQ